jgi:hypothetical protein
MARYNTVITAGSVSTASTLQTPFQGTFTSLTGTAPYTVDIPAPALYTGVSQTFYNATSGTITLRAGGSANFIGGSASGANTQTLSTGGILGIVSDGTAWVVTISGGGGAISGTTGTFSSDLNANGTNGLVTTQLTFPLINTTATTINFGGAATTINVGANSTSSVVAFKGTTASTSTTTGAVTVAGGLGVAGALYAQSKSFDIEHPTKPGYRLMHGSLEGPEFGVYVRGRLTSETVIQLPEYWTGLVNESTITVNVTPIGSKQDIWVAKVENNQVFLDGNVVDCYYTVYAERKDIASLTVEIKE